MARMIREKILVLTELVSHVLDVEFLGHLEWRNQLHLRQLDKCLEKALGRVDKAVPAELVIHVHARV